MTKSEFAQIASALKTFYVRDNFLPNNEAMTLWYEELKDIPYQIARPVTHKWVQTNKFPPTIAEIREMAAGMAGEPTLDWNDGWEQVTRAIRKYGYINESEALESMDEITRKCVKQMGWMNICTSDNIVADRANFRMAFQSLAERKKKESQMSLELRQIMEQIQLSAKDERMAIEQKIGE
jgi:hypothetical protein